MAAKQTNRSSVPLILMGIGAILILGILGWYIYTLSTPASDVPPPAAVQEDNFPEVERVSLEDAKGAYDQGSAVFVDVRDAEAYAESHVAGAVSIPLYELQARMAELDPQAWIITYCT